jgi:hypothetical protein
MKLRQQICMATVMLLTIDHTHSEAQSRHGKIVLYRLLGYLL